MTWLITGASRGLGRALALEWAARGERVVAAARDTAALQALADAAPQGRILPLRLDLRDAGAIRPTLQASLLALLGPVEAVADPARPRLSGIVNNAGLGWYRPFADHSEAELIDIVQVNLTAAMLVCHAVLPRLMAQGSGHVVNIASDLARRPLGQMAAYAASKHGLAGFSQSLLREVKGQGIKVSLVNPGIIDTGFGGGAAEGTREESWSLRPAQLARLIADLASQPGSLVVDEISVHAAGQDF